MFDAENILLFTPETAFLDHVNSESAELSNPKIKRAAMKRFAWKWKLYPELQFVIPRNSDMRKINDTYELIPFVANAQASIYPVSSYIDLKGLFRAPLDVIIPIYVRGKLTFLTYSAEYNIFRTATSIIADFCHLLAQEQIRVNWPRKNMPTASRFSAHRVLMMYTTKKHFELNNARSSSDVFPWCMRTIRRHSCWIDACNALMQQKSQSSKNPLSTMLRKQGITKELSINISSTNMKKSLANCRLFGHLNSEFTKKGVNYCTCKVVLFIFFLQINYVVCLAIDCPCAQVITDMFVNCGGKEKFKTLSPSLAAKHVYKAAMQDVMQNTSLVRELASYALKRQEQITAKKLVVYLSDEDIELQTLQELEAYVQKRRRKRLLIGQY
jgi:hypothetical protein